MSVVSLRPQVPSPHHAARRCPARGARGGRGARLPRYVPRGGHREERHRRRDLRPKYREGTEERGRMRVSVIANSHGKRLGIGRGGERVGVEGVAQPLAPLQPASSGSAREPVPHARRRREGGARSRARRGAAGPTSALNASSLRTCIASSVPMYHGETQLTRTPSCRRRGPQALRGAAPCGGAAGGAPWPTRTRGSLLACPWRPWSRRRWSPSGRGSPSRSTTHSMRHFTAPSTPAACSFSRRRARHPPCRAPAEASRPRGGGGGGGRRAPRTGGRGGAAGRAPRRQTRC